MAKQRLVDVMREHVSDYRLYVLTTELYRCGTPASRVLHGQALDKIRREAKKGATSTVFHPDKEDSQKSMDWMMRQLIEVNGFLPVPNQPYGVSWASPELPPWPAPRMPQEP